METIIINSDLFKENSPIQDDTLIDKFIPYIAIAQAMYIENIIGRPLMDELKEQVNAASQNDATGDEITPLNKALIRIIAPALSFYAVYQGLPFHWAAIVNKGVTIRESENSKGVDIQDIGQLKRWLKDDAESWTRRLLKYLCDCKGSYPLWKPSHGCGCEDSNEGRDSAPLDTGLYIPTWK